MKVGLSLSGGAAKGIVHLGVIEELEKSGVKIDMVGGCSIGALVGAMYAADPDIDRVNERVREFLDSTEGRIIPIDYLPDEEVEEQRSLMKTLASGLKKSIYYGISLTQLAYLDSEVLRNSIKELVPDVDIKDLPLPFVCSATDIANFTPHYFESGSLVDAVVASCSMPGLYPPLKINGSMLIDGGWAAPSLVDNLRDMGARFVIGSDIVPNMREYEISSGLDVTLRANEVSRHILSEMELAKADFIIQPDTCNINWWDFSVSQSCINLGKNQTRDRINELKKKMFWSKIKYYIGISDLCS